MTKTKKDLIDYIAASTGQTHVLVKAVVQQLFNEIISGLAKRNRIELRDFFVFETRTTPARMAQNPRTLERTPVPARRRVVFREGKLMREGMNGNGRERDRRSCVRE